MRDRLARLGSARLPRDLHPVAWWLWALGLATAASLTTNPYVLLLLIGVACLAVAARRSAQPWADSFRIYLWLGVAIVVIRVLFRILLGGGDGGRVLIELPEIPLPHWTLGLRLLGPVTQESLLSGLYDGLRLAAIVICVGSANALANPKRLLRSVPPALYEVGSALVVAVTVLPQLADSVRRVRAAQTLRGGDTGRVESLRRVLVPVLEDALERSLALAAGMDTRGYGRSSGATPRERRTTGGADARRPRGRLPRGVRRARPDDAGLARTTDARGRGGGLVRGGPARRAPGRTDDVPTRSVALARAGGRGLRTAGGRGRVVDVPAPAVRGLPLGVDRADREPVGARGRSGRSGRCALLAAPDGRPVGRCRVIELRGVHFGYPDTRDRPVLRDVDLTIDESELVLVSGRTGVGKSTLLGVVTGLVPRFSGGTLSGDVLVDGRSIVRQPPRERAHVVGYVGQDPAAGFVTDSVEEELAYGMEQLGLPSDTMRRRVEETFDLLGIAALRSRDLRTLSGGEQQRVAIGSILTMHPRVLVLDEPTSALDPTAAEEVLATLTRLVHDLGVAVLMAEHRLERVVPFADRMLLLTGDGSVRSGTPARRARRLTRRTADRGARPGPAAGRRCR